MFRKFSIGDVQHIAWRDVLMTSFAAWFLVCLVVMAMITKAQDLTKAQLEVRDALVWQIKWPDGTPYDVDLWVRGPEGKPVGFSNHNGPSVSLLRDDLGSTGDLTKENWEEARSRGLVAGTWDATIMLWSPHGGPLPMTVEAIVTLVQGKTVTPIWSGSVELDRNGEERTVARFRLGADLRVVPDSVNRLDVALWEAR